MNDYLTHLSLFLSTPTFFLSSFYYHQAYSQMPTTFIVQGTVMKPALFGILDAATMNMLDCFSVLFFGFVTGQYFYPKLAEMGYTIPTTYKFALGSFLGALAISWSLFVEHRIHSVYESTGEAISVLWQAPSYILIGWGEIYAISAAYEAAFSVSSPQQKVMASAVNLFAVGGIPSFTCVFLQQACSSWFKNTTRGDGNISRLKDYATASVHKYFEVLLLILLVGICLNIFPPIRDFVESIEDLAAEMIKTPVPTRPVKLQRENTDNDDEEASRPSGERTPLLAAPANKEGKAAKPKKKMYNVEDLDAPVMYRLGTMRAGALQPSERENRKKKLKRFGIFPRKDGSK
jgi:proton-dependent oligopeptide transporter, POT family